jgi:hypothetical protein
MKSIKFIVVIFLIFLFCLPIAGEKRPKRKSMQELTDPKSPSYVPVPYPKTREEIITDLKYYAEKYCKPSEGVYESYVEGFVPMTEIVLANLLEPQPKYRIGEIIKVKNRIAQLPDKYTWLIFVMDNEGNIALRAAMLESGLMAKCGAIRDSVIEKASPEQLKKMDRFRKSIKNKDVKNILSESLGHVVEDQDIKKMERIAYFSTLGEFLNPIWEIKMADGTIYYYSRSRDMVYRIEKKLPWKKNSNGRRKGRAEMAQNREYLPDTINDEFVILTRIPKKKKI